MTGEFRALGRSGAPFEGLDTFPAPAGVERVYLESDEVTAVCPITGQPDWYVVKITYLPRERCVESKSLKLYFQTFRNEGVFCESLSAQIARDLFEALECPVEVTVVQKPRGGIAIHSTASEGGAE